MKKILSLVLCLVFCLSVLAGCGGLEGEEKGANVRVFLSDYPYTLDPAVVQLNSDVEQLLYLLFEPLTIIDEDGEVQPGLAEEWYYKYDEIYQLHKMYFVLKETSWSDNRAVSADDVVYAWRRILDPEMDSPYAAILYPIKGARALKSGEGTVDDLGVAAVDDTLLEITFDSKYDIDLFAEQVANVHLAPCREDVVTRSEKNGEDWAGSATNIVSNGKFRVQSMDMPRAARPGEEDYSSEFACKLVLERNAFYMRDPEKDDLDETVLPYRITCYYAEGQMDYYENEKGLSQEMFQANRFKSGELYFLSAFDKESYEFFKNSSEYELETASTTNGYAFYFNTENDILSDANVRKALSAILDRNALAGVAGTGEIAANGYVPNGVFNTDNESDFRAEGGALYNTGSDSTAANNYLASASKKSGTLTVTYLIPWNAYTVASYSSRINYNNVYENVAKKAGEYWASLGYTINYRGLNPDEYLNALITRDYDIIGVNVLGGSVDAFTYLAPFAKEFSGTGTAPDPSITEGEVFSTHYTNIDDADYSKLIEDALAAATREERAQFLHQAEAKLVDLCPATMVYWYSHSYVARDEVDGYEVNNWFGYVDFGELELDDWREVNAAEAEVSEQRKEK